jgi:ribosome-associated protein
MSDHLNTVHSAYSTIRANPGEATSSQANGDPIWKLVLTIAEAAEDRKGADVLVLGVSEVSDLADYFVLITGFSRVQVRAISQGIQQKVEQQMERRPRRSEGEAQANWVLLDYGDVIVHILMPHEREFYNLEAFWGHAQRIELPALKPVGK